MLDRPAILLKLEEAGILVAAILFYYHLHFSWMLFAVLFFGPDLFMFGFLISPRTGSATYNLAHTLFLAIPVLLFAYYLNRPTLLAVSIIWIAHIAFDRTLGYGLKYPTTFKDTHLQHVP